MNNLRQWAISLLGRLLEDAMPFKDQALSKEQALGLLAELHQNTAFMRYLNARERYLVDSGMENFIGGKSPNAFGLAGQLIEVRNLRFRVKAAHIAMDKLRKEEKVKQAEKQEGK